MPPYFRYLPLLIVFCGTSVSWKVALGSGAGGQFHVKSLEKMGMVIKNDFFIIILISIVDTID